MSKNEDGGLGGALIIIVLILIIGYLLLQLQKKDSGTRTGQAANRGSPGHAPSAGAGGSGKSFEVIRDKYETIGQVVDQLRRAGLESSQLILGIDFTASNNWTGKQTFGGLPLHELDHPRGLRNPYESAISIVARTLRNFDEDGQIPAFAFGDARTKDKSVRPLRDDGRPCNGLDGVLRDYRRFARHAVLSGPTSFAPLIRAAIGIVQRTREYHILVIIADGQVSAECREETERAIVEAANYALSIVIVGVGDGPWDEMERFDDELPARQRDMVQFVPFHRVVAGARNPEAAFALCALQEIPDQYKMVSRDGLLRRRRM